VGASELSRCGDSCKTLWAGGGDAYIGTASSGVWVTGAPHFNTDQGQLGGGGGGKKGLKAVRKSSKVGTGQEQKIPHAAVKNFHRLDATAVLPIFEKKPGGWSVGKTRYLGKKQKGDMASTVRILVGGMGDWEKIKKRDPW